MFKKMYKWAMGLAGHKNATPVMGAISFAESSFCPIPADIMFIPMCLAKPEKSMHYALVASITSILGGILGWAIGLYAFDLLARPVLEATHKMGAFNELKAQGEGLIPLLLFTSGASHIPPMKVVTILSGAMQFNLLAFIGLAIVARAGRFYALAFLLKRYGVQVEHFIEKRLPFIAAGVVVVAIALYFALKH